MKIIVALGGNALIEKRKEHSFENQQKAAKLAMKNVAVLVSAGHKVAVMHGNGFQVGQLLLQSPFLPLEVDVAESQGQIGYLLSQALLNEFSKRLGSKTSAVVLTHVVVDKNDQAFKNPSKPIGPAYSKKEVLVLQKKGVKFVKEAGKGYRRVVASPAPQEIVELKTISKLFNSSTTVICCGGGGIPVVKENGMFKGVGAVIDKDLASSLLAIKLKAGVLLILAAVDFVFLNFGKKNQKKISQMTIKEAKKYLREGHFSAGSMGPKILAAIKFLENGGEKVIICSVKNALMALKGKTGTVITR
ncbi:MAG: carbamate kinase [Candidatus Staskawiczbacteria bacterium]|nr:carbamate kinase [Candidatus Staskawiczbacteria bacterium]